MTASYAAELVAKEVKENTQRLQHAQNEPRTFAQSLPVDA